jgi:hypothetical protein
MWWVAGRKQGSGEDGGPRGHPTGTQRCGSSPGRGAQGGRHRAALGPRGEGKGRHGLGGLRPCRWAVTPRGHRGVPGRAEGTASLGLSRALRRGGQGRKPSAWQPRGLLQPVASGPRKPVCSGCHGQGASGWALMETPPLVRGELLKPCPRRRRSGRCVPESSGRTYPCRGAGRALLHLWASEALGGSEGLCVVRGGGGGGGGGGGAVRGESSRRWL